MNVLHMLLRACMRQRQSLLVRSEMETRRVQVPQGTDRVSGSYICAVFASLSNLLPYVTPLLQQERSRSWFAATNCVAAAMVLSGRFTVSNNAPECWTLVLTRRP